MENIKLYEKFKAVPSNALKNFKNGSFSGTDIDTMWRIKTLTEEFGPCGVGWYFDIIRTWTENGVNDEIMCFVEIKLYIKYEREWSKGISGTGGHKVIQYFSGKGYNSNNDEGYKMAVTDAFGVACKHLGIGADVYWDNDKSKYNNDNDKKAQPPKKVNVTAINYMTEEQKAELLSLGADLEKVARHYDTTVHHIRKEQAEEAIQIKQKQILEGMQNG